MKIIELKQDKMMKVDGGKSKKKGYKAEIEIWKRQSKSRGGKLKRRVEKRKIYGGRIFNPIGALIALGEHFYKAKNKTSGSW